MTWQHIFNDFIDDQLFKNNSKKTISGYRQFLMYFFNYTDTTPQNIILDDVKDYYFYLKDKKTLSDRTISTYMRHLKVFLNFCVKKYDLSPSIADFDIPKYKKKQILILSAAELKAIFNVFDTSDFYNCRNKLFFALLIELGLRHKEVIDIKINNIKNNRILITGKGNKERILPLGINILSILDKYLLFRSAYDINKVPQLFINYKGDGVSYYFPRKILNYVKKVTGINRLYLHLFRHSFATWYLINGGDPLRLKLILGHTQLKMVDYYTHLANQYLLTQDDSFLDNLFGSTDF